jgi:hypothetical protein
VVLYTARNSRYILNEGDVEAIIEQSGDTYSESMKRALSDMADAYNDLVYGLNNPENESFRFKE